jgi:hypothetical protein
MTTNKKGFRFEGVFLNDGCNMDAEIDVLVIIIQEAPSVSLDDRTESVEAPG